MSLPWASAFLLSLWSLGVPWGSCLLACLLPCLLPWLWGFGFVGSGDPWGSGGSGMPMAAGP